MTLAPTNEHSGGTRRKTYWLKTPHVAYKHREKPCGKKNSLMKFGAIYVQVVLDYYKQA